MNDSRVVEIPELVQGILRELDRDRLSLASCARVSKFWSEIALDTLWRDLDSLRPLLRLLGLIVPGYAREKGTGRTITTMENWSVGRLPTEKDWERLSTSYAPRIRSLTLDVDAFTRVFRGKEMVLPALQKLRCPLILEKPDDIINIYAFLTPSLKALQLPYIKSNDDDELQLTSVLLQLIAQWPGFGLEYLDISSLLPGAAAKKSVIALISLVSNQAKISHLKISVCDEWVHRSISHYLPALSCLRKLEVTILLSTLITSTDLSPDIIIPPLLAVRQLEELVVVSYFYDFPLTGQRVADMGSAWPFMTRLRVQALGNPHLLSTFSRHLPQLEELGYRIDWRGISLAGAASTRFAALKTLFAMENVGQYRGPKDAIDIDPAARLLAAACPPGVLILSGGDYGYSSERETSELRSVKAQVGELHAAECR